MKRIKNITILLALAAAAGAASAATFTDTARVVRAQPIYMEHQCENSDNRDQGNNVLGSAIGGIAGGLLGNQVGGGNGRTAATAVGAVVGAMTGNSIARDSYRQGNSRDCGARRQTGYEVVYEYRGTQYTTTTRQAPGRSLPVKVSVEVTPLEQY